MPERSHVALTRCFYCMEPDKILLATRYNHKGEPIKDLKPADGKVIDMEPCQKCQDWMEQGIILIGIEEAKCDPGWHTPPRPSAITGKRDENWMPNPWRSGGFAVIKEEAFKRLVQGEEVQEFALKHRWMFMEHEAMVMTGIIQPEEKADEG